MVYLKNSNSFFKKMPPERLFASTAGAVVPKDRRLSSQASAAELWRKPKPAASTDPSIVTVRPEAAGKQEARLQQAYHKFAKRLSSMTPISFSACSTIKGVTPRGGHTTPTGVAWSTTSTPRGGTTPTPRTAQDPAPRPSADPFPPMDHKPGAQFTHYDAVQQAWRKHAAGKSPGGGRGLEVYRRCMGEPTQKTAQDYLRPNTARDSRDDKVRMLRRSYAKASSRDELDLKDAADERDLLPKRREQETPPLKMDRTWQTFRSSKTTAFPKPPQEYILKDYMLRDVTHRVYEGPADNEMVQTNALYCSTAFINTDRPLAKPTTAPSEQMRQLKRDAARAPVPKGRRNLNSVEFLGALSHDFCPIAGHENATQPTDYSYAVWNGNGRSKIETTVIQSLPTKAYGDKVHPGLYDEKITIYEGPVDRRFLQFRNVDILDRNIEVRAPTAR